VRHTLRHQPIGNYPWMVLIRRAELPQPTKTVAFILATYADPDGSNACVGQERLADESMNEERYARDSLKLLAGLGLIELTRRGKRAGDADTYQLTTPGAGFAAVQMRRDPTGLPVDAEGRPLDGKRPKAASVRDRLAALTGTPVPVRKMPEGARTGTGGPVEPVDNRVGGPVDNPPYRPPSAGTGPDPADPYRPWGDAIPALGERHTGPPVPPTNLYQPSPTRSPQVSTSPGLSTPDQNDHEVLSAQTITDDEYKTAYELLAALPAVDYELLLKIALDELHAGGIRDPPTRLVIARAADIATRPGERP
jgi:hypothetical protein